MSDLPIYFRATGPAPLPEDTFWLVVVTFPSGRQMEVTPHRDNRREARAIAANYRSRGMHAYVVKRHEWVSDSGRRQASTSSAGYPKEAVA